jgi:hypothetical protein
MGQLPSGASVGIAGTPPRPTNPAAGASYHFTLTATDTTGSTATIPLTWNVSGDAVRFTSTPSAVTTLTGDPGTARFAAASSNLFAVAWAVSGAPEGVSISADGLLTGSPTKVGSWTLTVTATDSYGISTSAPLRWSVNPHTFVHSGALAITTAKHGQPATVSVGTFRKDSSRGVVLRPSVRYQWLLDGRTIRGATSAHYKVPAAKKGHRLSCTITASAPGYSTVTLTTKAARIS